jgi:hypothetical protein
MIGPPATIVLSWWVTYKPRYRRTTGSPLIELYCFHISGNTMLDWGTGFCSHVYQLFGSQPRITSCCHLRGANSFVHKSLRRNIQASVPGRQQVDYKIYRSLFDASPNDFRMNILCCDFATTKFLYILTCRWRMSWNLNPQHSRKSDWLQVRFEIKLHAFCTSKWKWPSRFIHLTPEWNRSRLSLHWSLGGPISQSGRDGQEKHLDR